MTAHEQTTKHACFGTSRDPIDYEKLIAFFQTGYDAGERDANLKISMLGQMANDVLEARELLKQLVEGEDTGCRYDHNDLCQEHYHERPCAVRTARDLLRLP